MGKGGRREKTISKGFDITWEGGQNTKDRGWLDIPWGGGSISSRANVDKIYIYVHHEK